MLIMRIRLKDRDTARFAEEDKSRSSLDPFRLVMQYVGKTAEGG